MNDRAFNEELRRFLMKEPGESVESVVDKLLHAPHGVQQNAKQVIQKLLADAEPKPGPLSKEEAGTVAILKAWVSYASLILVGLVAKETCAWALIAAENGTCSAKSAHEVILQTKELYDDAERRLGPMVDALMRYENAITGMKLTACEFADQIENEVFELELKSAASLIGSGT